MVSGLRISEPAADLAVAAAITSSLRCTRACGYRALSREVGLSGELRMVNHMPTRLKEAAKLGEARWSSPSACAQGEPWPPGHEAGSALPREGQAKRCWMARSCNYLVLAGVLSAEPPERTSE